MSIQKSGFDLHVALLRSNRESVLCVLNAGGEDIEHLRVTHTQNNKENRCCCWWGDEKKNDFWLGWVSVTYLL
jgi:hypothetical protein